MCHLPWDMLTDDRCQELGEGRFPHAGGHVGACECRTLPFAAFAHHVGLGRARPHV